MNKNNKKQGSPMRKIMASAGMLSVSAMMLASSTYAWFTMSREVEVQNIQMTATVPEDMQISLGQIMNYSNAASTAEAYSLAKGTGLLLDASGIATAPREQGTANHELDWSNIADISAYYEFGKLIPASSTDGLNVYYTPDAAGVGRTFTATANFYQAAAGATAYKTGGSAAVGNSEDSAKATSFIKTATQKPASGAGTPWGTATGGYTTALEWNDTNDDGYYIDIPVWLRTSSTGVEQDSITGTTKVYVSGYVTSQGTADVDSDVDDLYKAVRVAILSTSGDNGATYAADKGCLTLADGLDKYINPVTGQGTHAAKFPTWTGFANILDSDNYNATGTSNKSGIADIVGRANGVTGVDSSKIYALSGTSSTINAANVKEGTLSEITQNNAKAADNVAVLKPGTGQGYGESTKLIIRVWLEGEDGNCWNANAGQNWNIALKFSKNPLPTSDPTNG